MRTAKPAAPDKAPVPPRKSKGQPLSSEGRGYSQAQSVHYRRFVRRGLGDGRGY